jgi:signal transduction histidine kinase
MPSAGEAGRDRSAVSVRQRKRFWDRAPWGLARGAAWSIQRTVPASWRLTAIALLGACAAAGVGYAAAGNPQAAPPHVAVALRVLIVGTFVAVGVYAAAHPVQARMGAVLIAAGLYASLWLLNGSGSRLPFSIGVLVSGVGPTIFAYVMLAHPTGRVASHPARIFLLATGLLAAVAWALLIATHSQPPLKTPLLRCAPRCPANSFYLGSTGSDLDSVLKGVVTFVWALIALASPLFIAWRARSSSSIRRVLIPVEVAALANALLWVSYFAARIEGSDTSTFGALYVGTAVTIPLAMLVGLGLERLFMGQALADFTTELVQTPRADPAVLMGSVLGDSSLTIAYRRPGRPGVVDFAGEDVVVPRPTRERAVVWIERDAHPIAAVTYDANLETEAGFVQAAGAAVIMRLEAAQLEADLRASTRELAASRIRLMEVADAERQRIERDIHDGVQQQIVGLRIKLDLAAEEIEGDPARGHQMVLAIGRQMDDLIATLRALARGIYPSLLTERGLTEALRSVTQLAPVGASFRADGIGRYAEDVEVAVYFCCLEAIQNVVKHGGSEAHVMVRLWEDGDRLRFEVNDSGAGFDSDAVKPGTGMVNMRDRIEAVGGTLTITSAVKHGTSILGAVPNLLPGAQPVGI